MNLLALLETIADLPAVQEPVATAVADEAKKVLTDAAGQKAVADFLALLASKIKPA